MSKLFLSLISLCVCLNANAFDYHISGFVGATYTGSTVNVNYLDDPLNVGILGSAKLSDNFDANLFLHYTGEERVENIVAFGFLSYHNAIDTIPFEIQGGRFKYDFGLHGGDLNNPRQTPQLLAPQSIYWDPLHFALGSADGFRIMTEYERFQFSFSYGKSITNNSQREVFAWINMPEKYLPFKDLDMNGYFGSTSYGFVKYADDNNIVKIGAGHIDQNAHISGQYITFGYQFNYKDFTFEEETLLVRPTYKGAVTSFTELSDLSKGHSFTLSYQINDSLKTFFNFNTYESRAKISPLFQKTKSKYQDFSIGFVYDINDSIMLRAEIHKSNGSRLIPEESALFSTDYEDYYTGLVNLSYFF